MFRADDIRTDTYVSPGRGLLLLGLAGELFTTYKTQILSGIVIERQRHDNPSLWSWVRSRLLDSEKLIAALSGKPRAHAEVLYAPYDGEAYMLGVQLKGAFEQIGWTVSGPKHVPEEGGNPNLADAPPAMRWGADIGGIAVRTHLYRQPDITDSACRASVLGRLSQALMESGLGCQLVPDSSLPDNTYVIVVGEKPT